MSCWFDALLTTFPELLSATAGKWGVYMGLFFASFVKFGMAALAAMGNSKLNFVEILVTIGGGALLSVPFYTFFGERVRRVVKRFFKRKKPVSFSRRRRIYNIWHRYGIWGAAVLSPIISPMVAVGIAVSFQESPRRIISIIGGVILLWSLVFALLRQWVLSIVEAVGGVV